MRFTAILLAVLALSAPAHAFRSESGLWVASENAEEFVVKYKSTAKLTDYWCAAGDYVIRRLALDGTTRVYRLSPPPRKAGQGIRFTLSPAGAADSTGLTSAGDRDGSISAGTARARYCHEVEFRLR